jgi:hypothetical protein
MRKAMNENPIVQIGLLGGLAVIVGLLLMTRVLHHKGPSAPTTSTTPTTGAVPSPGTASGTGTAAVPPTAAPATPVPGTAAPADIPSGRLVAGPGLPKPVASAYARNKAIVLLITRHRGIEDDAVKASVELLRREGNLAVFVANAGKISRFSRITEGVNVNRVPALVVVRPRKLTQGPPVASVSYGFRGPDSVQQAVRDALYKGPTNLPYYPR